MSPLYRFDGDPASPARRIRASGMAERLDGSLYCVVCGFRVPCANPPLQGEALVRAASHVCPRPESEVSEVHKLHYDCWAALDAIMVEAGMNPKLQPAEAQAWLRERLQITPTGRTLQPPNEQRRPTPSITVAPEHVMPPVDYAALEARAAMPTERATNWTFRNNAFRCDSCGFEVKCTAQLDVAVLAQHTCPPGASALARFRLATALTALYSGRALLRQAAFDGARPQSLDGPTLAIDAVPHGLMCNRCQSLGPFVTGRHTSVSGQTDYYVRCSGCGSWDVRERSAALGPVTLGEHNAAAADQKAAQAVLSTPLQMDATGRIDAMATLLAAANACDAIAKREFGAARVPAPETADQHQAALVERDGLMCEAHPGLPFDHDPSCPGPGTPWVLEGRATIEEFIDERAGPDWTCAACASRGPFKNVKHETIGEPTDYDMECLACGSLEVHESAHEAFQVHIEKCTPHEDAPSIPAPGVEQ